jgi:formimidoylglutamate deiminase
VSVRQVIAADLTWVNGAFAPDVEVTVAPDGRIEAVGRGGAAVTRRLRGRALLPGFVNAHSHAFQRGLRGHAERFPGGPGTFWTWREAVYQLAERLDAAAFRQSCVQAYREMLDAGITTVGEFHYLHHSARGADHAFDEQVLQAACEAGIRIVLLQAYYATGGIGRRLSGAQERFRVTTPSAYWERMDRLAEAVAAPEQTLGAVVHSLRAAAPDQLAAVHAEAARRGLPFHIHVEEQREEIEDCLAAHGRRPMALLNELLETRDNVTAVHCTHTAPGDMECFLEAGGRVCVCPLTEANLGDGLPDLEAARRAAGRLSLGSDSNVRISFLEEMRWLEYGQRLRTERRGVLVEAGHVARTLLEAATAGGARSLGIATGAIEPGRWADFLTVDLAHPALAGVDADTLAEALVFGAGDEVIGETCVGGRWREKGR